MKGANKIDRAREFVEKSRNILVFTGAGISTSSGIPDYRGTTGIWTKREPVFYQNFVSSEKSRIDYWEYKLETHEFFRNAKPNAAHKSLVELEKTGKMLALVTQNIDSLHRKAGTTADKLIELHGNNAVAKCMECSKEVLMEEALEYFKMNRMPPKCECGGYLKPAVVMFGESLNPEDLKRAFGLAQKVDLVISIGSTLVVEPAASIPLMARQNGAVYLIINQGDTAHDNIADIKLEANACEVLPLIIEY